MHARQWTNALKAGRAGAMQGEESTCGVRAAQSQTDEQLPEVFIALHLHKLYRLRTHSTPQYCCWQRLLT